MCVLRGSPATLRRRGLREDTCVTVYGGACVPRIAGRKKGILRAHYSPFFLPPHSSFLYGHELGKATR